MREPPPGTVEAWALEYIQTTDLGHKLDPPPPPDAWELDPPVRRLEQPGRPDCLQLLDKAPKSMGPGALRHRRRRAQAFHTFLHHELQAAELMLWAVLAFPDSPWPFRRGLVNVALDEVRHMQMYRDHLRKLSGAVGDFPVRDWFWLRVPESQNPAEFVALMGMGLEGSNLDHARRFAARFRAFGDEEGARIQEQIADEEVGHVSFAVQWFEEFTGSRDFEIWTHFLPPPVTASMLWQEPVNFEDRRRAGMDDDFIERLRRT